MALRRPRTCPGRRSLAPTTRPSTPSTPNVWLGRDVRPSSGLSLSPLPVSSGNEDPWNVVACGVRPRTACASDLRRGPSVSSAAVAGRHSGLSSIARERRSETNLEREQLWHKRAEPKVGKWRRPRTAPASSAALSKSLSLSTARRTRPGSATSSKLLRRARPRRTHRPTTAPPRSRVYPPGSPMVAKVRALATAAAAAATETAKDGDAVEQAVVQAVELIRADDGAALRERLKEEGPNLDLLNACPSSEGGKDTLLDLAYKWRCRCATGVLIGAGAGGRFVGMAKVWFRKAEEARVREERARAAALAEESAAEAERVEFERLRQCRPVFDAVACNDVDALAGLLAPNDVGAPRNVDETNSDGLTALDAAFKANSADCFELLRARGATGKWHASAERWRARRVEARETAEADLARRLHGKEIEVVVRNSQLKAAQAAREKVQPLFEAASLGWVRHLRFLEARLGGEEGTSSATFRPPEGFRARVSPRRPGPNRTITLLDSAYRHGTLDAVGLLLKHDVQGTTREEAAAWYENRITTRKAAVEAKCQQLKATRRQARTNVAEMTARFTYRNASFRVGEIRSAAQLELQRQRNEQAMTRQHLFDAAEYDEVAYIQKMAGIGCCDLNCTNLYGVTLLEHAFKHGAVRLARFLLDRNAACRWTNRVERWCRVRVKQLEQEQDEREGHTLSREARAEQRAAERAAFVVAPTRPEGDHGSRYSFDDPEADHTKHGILCLQDKMITSAARAFQAGVRFSPCLVTHLNLARICIRIGQPADAKKEYQKALALDATNALALEGLRTLPP